MPTLLRVLSDDEVAAIHEQSLDILASVGIRVDSARARAILGAAGGDVDEGTRVVRLPRSLVEASLAAAPRSFALGGRRPGWSVPMNAGECTLMADGESTTVYDPATGERRAAVRRDWARATRLIDSIDEVGVYWRMVTAGVDGPGPGPAVAHWTAAFGLFGKHLEDEVAGPAEGRWLLEVLGVVFGGREAVRRDHPFSILYCPVSPLVMEAEHTDALLEVAGWEIPVAAMPMPMMGTSAPAGLRATITLGNAQVLGALCLVEAAAPGTPFIYAPALAVMEPRSGRWAGGGPEHGLLGAASTELARFYGLPATGTNGGADPFVPGIQASYERAINWTLTTLGWPDIMIGPGALGGASTLCLEQLVIDVEVYRSCRRLRTGVDTGLGETDLVAALAEVGHAGDFLSRTATRDAVRRGEWLMPRLGTHVTFDRWDAAGRPQILDQAREAVDMALASHEPLPLPEDVAAGLAALERRAREAPTPG